MSRTPAADLDEPEVDVHPAGQSRQARQAQQAGQAPGAGQARMERRFVYNGDPGGGSPEFLTRGNKPLKRRRKSPFKIVTLIAAISAVIVFYVWNKITVNRLAAEVDALQIRLNKLSSINTDLDGTIDKKSNLDKITKLARERLGMIYAPEQPTYFEVENYEPVPGNDRR